MDQHPRLTCCMDWRHRKVKDKRKQKEYIKKIAFEKKDMRTEIQTKKKDSFHRKR